MGNGVVANQAVSRDDPGLAPPAAARQLLDQLNGRIEPVPVSLLYRLGLILVATVMILLPLIYVGLIALVGYGVYLHATHDAFLLSGGGGRRSSGRGALLAYLGPLVVGGVLLLFMIKPLFARRAKSSNLKSLSRADEPLLFDFVDRLCDLVGAPRPRGINVDCQVNASASFRGGFLSLFGSNLVLTIGLPLAAGLNLRQLTGVLAHEFGHFAQGTAMRVSFIVRTINLWFARVVYERDVWDEQLEEWTRESGGGGIMIVLWATKGMVWVTRRTLWLLMCAGHAVSCFLLRQMEFDADRYEARVAGSETFVQTCRMLPQLSVASNGALADLSHAWNERKLCDDLPALVLHNAREMPDAVRRKVEAAVAGKRTGWFDTHPADADRIASALREDRPGVFTSEAPAALLFADFAAVSRDTSLAFYRQMLGRQIDGASLVPTDHLHRAQSGEIESHKALRRVFQARLTAVRPIFVATTPPLPNAAGDDGALAERLTNARARMGELLAGMGEAVERIEKADAELIRARNARALLAAGFKKVKPEDFGLTRGDQAGVSQGLAAAQEARRLAAAPFDELERVAAGRFEAAVALARSPEFAARLSESGPTSRMAVIGTAGLGEQARPLKGDATPAVGVLGLDVARLDRVVAGLAAFARAHPAVVELREQYLGLAALLQNLEKNSGNETLVNGIRAACTSVTRQLGWVRTGFGDAAYPFDHATAGLSLADFVVDAVPPAEGVGELFTKCDVVLDRAFGVYYRGMAVLAAATERVEAALGLAAFPDPPETEEAEGEGD